MRTKPTVLIANNGPNSDQALALHCEKLNLEVIAANSLLPTLMMARKHSPDIMIINDTMPMADGIKICERLNELQTAIPIIILTEKHEPEVVQNCESLGAHCLLKETGMWTKLEPLISELLQTPTQAAINSNDVQAPADSERPLRTSPLVLAIDDDTDVTMAMKIRLGFHGIDTIETSDIKTAFMIALRDKPDVIITDYRMPQGSGDYLVVRLRRTKETRSIPIIVLTGQTLNGAKDHSLERDLVGRCDASAFLMKPLNFDELIVELEKHIPVKPLKTFAA